MKKELAITILLISVAILLCGCATVNVPIPVTHPAEIDMNPYKQVAIAGIDGNMGRSFTDAIKRRLMETGRFKVVERGNRSVAEKQFNNVAEKQFNKSRSEQPGSRKSSKPAKSLSASATITGFADGRYSEHKTTERRTCTNYSNNSRYSCVYHYRKGMYQTSGSIDIMDGRTGRIIRSKLLNNTCRTSTSAKDDYPPPINRDALRSQCLRENVDMFMKALKPWTEKVMVAFRKDSGIPELERGINQARLGKMHEAIRIFASASMAAQNNAGIKPASIATAYWNLGLAYEYTWQFPEAKKALEKAYSIQPEQVYIDEINNVKRLKMERDRLTRQQVNK